MTSSLSVFTIYKSINLWWHSYQTCFSFLFYKKSASMFYLLFTPRRIFNYLKIIVSFVPIDNILLNLWWDQQIVGCMHTLLFLWSDIHIFLWPSPNRVANVSAIEYLPFRFICIDQWAKYWFAPSYVMYSSALIDHPAYSFKMAELHQIKSKSLHFTCTKVRENSAKIIRRIVLTRLTWSKKHHR